MYAGTCMTQYTREGERATLWRQYFSLLLEPLAFVAGARAPVTSHWPMAADVQKVCWGEGGAFI